MKSASSLRILATTTAISVLMAAQTWAHCDTMNGPVVKAAREALDRGDVSYALVWVKPTDEAEIRTAFAQVLPVRALGDAARAIADRYFFETLVRVHRAGEGAPFTGLKDAEVSPDPGIAAAELSLEGNSVEQLSKETDGLMHQHLEKAFRDVQRLKAYKPTDIEAGRRYVEAYVRYIHYVERLYQAVAPPESGQEHHDEGHVH